MIYDENTAVLVVDDEPIVLRTVPEMLIDIGVPEENIYTFQNGNDVIPFLQENQFRTVISFIDLFMSPLRGLDLLQKIKDFSPRYQCVIVSANDDIDTVVECFDFGADDYSTKPLSENRLKMAFKKIENNLLLHDQADLLRPVSHSQTPKNKHIFKDIVTNDSNMLKRLSYIEKIAPKPHAVLIAGETGTGKELIAKAIHDASGMPGKFVPVNVAGVDDQLFSDALFGHKKGAFTGADSDREGFVEKAAGGTLFLDEISKLSESSQVKLLRLLQEKVYSPLGSTEEKVSSARIVVAINVPLEDLIEIHGFKEDLFYRVSTFCVTLPPLRDRKEDIPILAQHFLNEASGNKDMVISPEAHDLLLNYQYKGNIRELQAFIEEAAAISTGVIDADTLKARIDLNEDVNRNKQISEKSKCDECIFTETLNIDELKEIAIKRALVLTDHHQQKTAELVGVSRQTVAKFQNNRI